MTKIIKSEVIAKPRIPLRSGILKSAMNVKDETKPSKVHLGKTDKFSHQVKGEQKLTDREKLKKKQKQEEKDLLSASNWDQEQEQVPYEYKAVSMTLWKQSP